MYFLNYIFIKKLIFIIYENYYWSVDVKCKKIDNIILLLFISIFLKINRYDYFYYYFILVIKVGIF